MSVRHLRTAPRLGPELARGGLGSLPKRGPYHGARLPEEQLVLRAAAVDPTKLQAYARVCGFADGFAEGAAPLPPAYPHILGFPLAMRLMAAPSFPFPLLGLVHTDIGLTQLRPLHSNDRPEVTVYADGPEPHRRGTRFGMVTEARLDGELCWHSRSTYLCRHRTGAAEGTPAAAQGPRERTAPALPVQDTWDLATDLGRRYAAASGDRNPIHLHPLTARLFGFPRHIAHGMWTFARCLAQAAPKGPAEGQRLTARARFKSPVLLPAAVTYGASAGGTSSGGGDGRGTEAEALVERGGRRGDEEAFELRGGRDGQRLHLTGSLRLSG